MSPTTREVSAGRAERLRRERRYFTSDKLGKDCVVCGIALPLVLDSNTHPTCDPIAMGSR